MSTDATPSWSGYIFQGEVALCKALEEINKLLGNDIPDTYCLKLEEDEDFSITTNIWEAFQVKAYGIHNYAKYSKAWDDMMRRFPDNAERNFLYLHKSDIELNKFNVTLEQERLEENVLSGVYTLENITTKIDDAIKVLHPKLNNSDVELKRNYCCYKICSAIKERHRTKTVKSFSLNEIREWILNSDLAFNDEIAWLSIIKNFFKTIRDCIEQYDENDDVESKLKQKLIRYLEEINDLPSDDIKVLIKDRINAHKLLDKDIKVENLTSYLSEEGMKEIIIKCFEDIIMDPFFKDLTYNYNENNYQLSLINISIDENSRTHQKKKLYEFCSNIENNNLSKINTIVTQNLNLEKEQVKDVLRNIMQPNFELETGLDITDKRFEFEFKSVENSIREINNG
ncbi:ABC-three component system protein [Flavobacterium tructae]|uniref:ABC-three component system protein n=1 Tax=Flavobacterium tructae TaxID=1114873 RepID=UPI0035A932B5